MAKYKIEWEDIMEDANGPFEAVEMALNGIQMGETLRFHVTNMTTGVKYVADMDTAEGDEDLVSLQDIEDYKKEHNEPDTTSDT